MVIAAAVAADGPNWTDILTAIGTVGAVVVAVGIALWTERRSDRRIREERQRGAAAVEDERAHGKAQLEEERRLARERDQLEQAYAVQVVLAQRPAEGMPYTMPGGELRAELKQMAAMVVNRGLFSVTDVDAQFAFGADMLPHSGYRRVAGFESVSKLLRGGYWEASESDAPIVLTPFDAGIRFETNSVIERKLPSMYPVVRWRDRWGTRWEHKRGVVRQVVDGDPWEP
jgi:hypothetical protein